MNRPTLSRFAEAYKGGLAPSEVATATLEAIARSDQESPPLRTVISPTPKRAHAQAEASSRRWREGEPLSVIDGVPFVVKDNLDVSGVRTTNGTVLDFPTPQQDAWIAARLSDAGAVLVGKANMHPIGAGTTGINPHYGTARNPWDPARWCGGSSSGSAGAVGAGLVSFAIGTDAGGSIRAPAAFVGAVGFKPTFGRTSRVGLSILCDTLDHIGPIAQCVSDAAAVYSLISRKVRDDEETWDQPSVLPVPELLQSIERPIDSLRIGVTSSILSSTAVEPDVANKVTGAIEVLSEAGATLQDVEIPSLEQCLLIGLVLLGSEGPSGLEDFLTANRARLSPETQVLLAVGEHFSARDYLSAQRTRHKIRDAWKTLFERVDAIVLPAAGIVAQRIRKDALETGELDEVTSAKAISCTFPSNLTGYPAISVPIGFTDGMPVSAQVVGAPWNEAVVLRVARTLERAGLARGHAPQRHFGDDILPS